MRPIVIVLAFAVMVLFALPDSAVAADGKTLFTSNKCTMCHGADGHGNKAMQNTDLTKPETKAKTDDQLKAVIQKGTDGKPKMKAYTFNDNELKALVAYIRAVQKEAK